EMKFTTFQSKETIKARKVTDKAGEDVVTSNGNRRAERGDYVVDRDGAVDVMQKADFENQFKTRTAPKPAAKKAVSKRTTTKTRK
ncbi:MAG TPA: hypothetical protein VF598_05015, partial [Hymenobacter sp.]